MVRDSCKVSMVDKIREHGAYKSDFSFSFFHRSSFPLRVSPSIYSMFEVFALTF
jgi:hypothetical protein